MDEKKTTRPAPDRAPASGGERAAIRPPEAVPRKTGASPPKQARPFGLTAREYEIVRLAAEGLYNREIAESLDLSVNTVKTHLLKAYRKYGVSSRPALRKIMKKCSEEQNHPDRVISENNVMR